MTRSKKAFAEMLVQAQGFGDADEIAKDMSLVDIIYAMKKAEEAEEAKKAEEAEEAKKAEEVEKTKKAKVEKLIEETVFESIWSRISPD